MVTASASRCPGRSVVNVARDLPSSPARRRADQWRPQCRTFSVSPEPVSDIAAPLHSAGGAGQGGVVQHGYCEDVALALSIIALVIALVSAGAAVGLWRSAHRANEISARAVSIDASRRHDERTPDFKVEIVQNETTLDHANLTVPLVRPAHLDEVVINILNEANADHWGSGRLPDRVTQREAELFVWGLWQFNTGASQQVADARTTLPRRYSRADGKDGEVFDLIKTRPGHWMHSTQQSWAQEHNGPVRLSFECRLDGEQPWQVSYDVTVGPGSEGSS